MPPDYFVEIDSKFRKEIFPKTNFISIFIINAWSKESKAFSIFIVINLLYFHQEIFPLSAFPKNLFLIYAACGDKIKLGRPILVFQKDL